jgi:hypothetical protein
MMIFTSSSRSRKRILMILNDAEMYMMGILVKKMEYKIRILDFIRNTELAY